MQEIHFRRVLESAPVAMLAGFDAAAAQAYVGRRAKVVRRGRPIHRDTIAKELKTLRSAWAWVAAKTPGVPPPAWTVQGLSLPKGRARSPFMTWGEIEREVGRGVLEDPEAEARRVSELWDCLWLDREQVRALLGHLAGANAPGFLRPMAVAAAFTGARRSELCRSLVGDWDVESRAGRLRQKKRDTEVEFSFRDVPMSDDLAAVLRDWFAEGHPGGARAFPQPDGSGVTWDSASHHLRAALAGSRWAVVKGWHVLRHSFASNLAAAGVDQRLIDRWMGHSTEIRWRYQHVRPDTARDAIAHL